MPTYLLNWNPKQYDWYDIQDCIDEIQEKGFYITRWSTGVTKRINRGDRLFLIKLGKEPRGIVGSGWAESNVRKGEHWNDSGRHANYVEVQFDILLNPDRETIFPRKELDIGLLGSMHWSSQASGISIPDDVAYILEDRWADFLSNEKSILPVAESAAIEGVMTETVRYVRGRNRQLRDLALKESKGVCCVCEIDFSKVLNGDGVRVLQVHHRKQMAASDSPRVTRMQDLAVVCANCHMLIHTNPRKALRVEVLKKRLSRSV